MKPTDLLLEEKKRALGLSSVSKAAVGLAALLPAVALATPPPAPVSGIFTPVTPLQVPTNDTIYWDPYSTMSGNPYYDSTSVLGFGTCNTNIYGTYGCGAGFSNVSVNWATASGSSPISQFSPGDTIDSSLNFNNGAYGYGFSIPDGTTTYFAYQLHGNADSIDSYGWVEVNYTTASGYSIVEWGTEYNGAITIPASTPVPEPSTYALIFGVVFAGVAVMNRWRRRLALAV